MHKTWGGIVAGGLFVLLWLFILIDLPWIYMAFGNLLAVADVPLNLAMFFGYHVFWPAATEKAPFSSPFEWLSLAIGAAAYVALLRYKVGIIVLIGTCGAIGPAVRLLL